VETEQLGQSFRTKSWQKSKECVIPRLGCKCVQYKAAYTIGVEIKVANQSLELSKLSRKKKRERKTHC